MNTIYTTHFEIEMSSSSSNLFYAGDRNWLKIRFRSGFVPEKFSFESSISGTAKYISSEDGVLDIDITSYLRLYAPKNRDLSVLFSVEILSSETTETISFTASIAEGMNPIRVANWISNGCQDVAFLENVIDFPQFIYADPFAVDNLRIYGFVSLSPFKSENIIQYDRDCAVVDAGALSFSFSEMDDTLILQRILRQSDEGQKMCTLEFSPMFGVYMTPTSLSDDEYRLPRMLLALELREMNIETDGTELMEITNGFDKYLDGVEATAKVGIKNLCASDFAYYSAVLLGATDCYFATDYTVANYEEKRTKCSIKTNKATIRTTAQGTYDFEIELNLYSNAN